MFPVRLERVSRDFGPVRVLEGISLTINPSQVLALIGENGAGKSTLMKILAGYLEPTSGQVVLGDRPVRFRSPKDAEACGIALIHQEFALAEHLSVAQNIYLGHEPVRGPFIDEHRLHQGAREVLSLVGIRLDPRTPVSQLTVAQKQLVEVAKALSRRARLLIMDEPTASLTPEEAGRLFTLIGQLKAEGAAVVYISHKLEEVKALADRVAVLRDGRLVAEASAGDLSKEGMARLMVGREVREMFPPKPPLETKEEAFRAEGVSVPGWVTDVSFRVYRGEVLGFAGLVGSGRTELFEGILGLRPRSSGFFWMHGHRVALRNPAEAVRAGLAYLSEDRKGKGLHLGLGLRENLTLMALERYARPWLDPARELRALEQALHAFGIRASRTNMRAGELSGGNQQKLALAKVLQTNPTVVVLDEPTRGVDVGAKREIYFLIQRLSQEGRSVIVISSELLELIGLCHRVVVMREGRICGVLDESALTEEEIIAYATGLKGGGLAAA